MRRSQGPKFVAHLPLFLLSVAWVCLTRPVVAEAADLELLNQKWQFSLRYPDTWKYTEGDPSRGQAVAVFSHKTADDEIDHATIGAMHLKDPANVADLVTEYRRRLEADGARDVLETATKLGPLPARRITWTNLASGPGEQPLKRTQVFADHAGLVYVLAFGGARPDYDRLLPGFETVLNSFVPKMKPVAARAGFAGKRYSVSGESLSLTLPENWRLRPVDSDQVIVVASTWELKPEGGPMSAMVIAALPLQGNENLGTDNLPTWAAKEVLAAARASQPAEKSSEIQRIEVDGKPAATFWTDRRVGTTVVRSTQYLVAKPGDKAVYQLTFSASPDRAESSARIWDSIIKSAKLATE